MNTKLQALLAAAVLVTVSHTTVQAQSNPNPGIVPPHAKYAGKTAGEYTAAWWEWVIGTPGNVQMFDGTGEHAYVNGNGDGPVFFLAKSWVSDEDGNFGVPQVREVVIPPGKALLVPVMGLGGPRRDPYTPETWVDFVFSFLPTARDLSVVIDGRPVAGLEDGNLHYLNTTGLVDLQLADGTTIPEFFGYEISLLLTPLTPGVHVIEMKGKGSGTFATDVTYILTVLP